MPRLKIDRKKFARLLRQGKTDAEIAKAVGSTPEGVAKIRRTEYDLVYEKGPSVPVMARHKKKKGGAWKRYETMADAARATGLSVRAVGNQVNGLTQYSFSGWEFKAAE